MTGILKKVLFVSTLLLLLLPVSYGQRKSKMPDLDKQQDSLGRLADDIVNKPGAGERFRADSFFIRMLVRTLKTPYSFNYPFDSLISISKLVAPDSSFRIFTWQVKKDEMIYQQRGAIQEKTADGSLKLIPLHDISMFTGRPNDSVRNANNWVGAIYYRIIEKEANGKKIYSLLGFDSYSIGSNKKWLEVLTFTPEGQPQFGGPYFSFKDDSGSLKKRPPARFSIEYKKEASTTFNYDSTLDMLVYDHLTSEDDEPTRKESFVPDGDYEGFKWQNGQWLHVVKVFNSKLKDGEYPQDLKILNDAGGIDENKLRIQSDQNQNRKKKGKQADNR